MQNTPTLHTLGFLTPEYPLPNLGYTGGIGTSIKNLADFYVNKGIQVVVFIYGRTENKIFKQENKTFVFIKKSPIGKFGWIVNRFRIQRIVNDCIKKYGIQFLEAPEWTGISSFIQFNCPLILKLHGSDTYFCQLEGRKLKSRNFWFEKSAFKQADHIIAVSDFVGKKSSEWFGVPRPYQVIHNGINPDRCSNPKQPSTRSGKTILYFGSLIRKKGVLEIPGIFNRVHALFPQVKLILAGNDAFDIATGSDSTWGLMKDLFTPEAFENVSYIGLVPSQKVDLLLAEVDVCIFPSYAEAFPVSWLEAMAQGKAVVASNIGWSSEVILNSEVGLTAHPSDHAQFANHIVSLLLNSQLRDKLGQEARKCVIENFSIEQIGRQHIDFFQEVLNQ